MRPNVYFVGVDTLSGEKVLMGYRLAIANSEQEAIDKVVKALEGVAAYRVDTSGAELIDESDFQALGGLAMAIQ